jgi:small subunit ribosomal protein S16
MLKIRLKKIGRKKLACYRIVIMQALTKRDGRAIDELGSFNPHNDSLLLDKKKFLYWLNCGAQPTNRIRYLVKKITK